MTHRSSRLFAMLLTLGWLPNAGAAEVGPIRPNILWLVAEDFGPQLGCYGTSQVESPHLDRLAAEGVRYTRFFTTAPVCSASRSAFMTGFYQTTIDAHHHRSHRGDGYTLAAGIRVLPEWLHDAGYFTANLKQLPKALGFSGTAKDDWNFKTRTEPWNSTRWDDLKSHQPFYAQLNFHETHRDFNGPPTADPAKVEVPPYYPEDPVIRRDWARYLDAASELDRKVGKVLAQLERDGLADNTVVVFFGDNGQAQVRGKQFCYDSGLHVPLIVRWPKGLGPAPFTPGKVDGRLMEALDLAPTMLALAGAKKPDGMAGRIFLGPQAEAAKPIVFGARDRCDETSFRFRSARDVRYRYIHNFTPDRPFLLANEYKETSYPAWNRLKELAKEGKMLTPAQQLLVAPTMPAEELYDIVSDPHETVNLASSTQAEHQAALVRLRQAVDEWIVTSKDAGADDDYPLVPAKPKPARKANQPAAKGTVTVRFPTFTQWGGFQRQPIGISEMPPHPFNGDSPASAVKWDCGVIF